MPAMPGNRLDPPPQAGPAIFSQLASTFFQLADGTLPRRVLFPNHAASTEILAVHYFPFNRIFCDLLGVADVWGSGMTSKILWRTILVSLIDTAPPHAPSQLCCSAMCKVEASPVRVVSPFFGPVPCFLQVKPGLEVGGAAHTGVLG